VEISSGPHHLSISNGQLVLRREGVEAGRIPVEDLGVLVIAHPAVTYTHAALTACVENKAAVVFCGKDHHPAGLMLPMEGHTVQAEISAQQATATDRLKDRLWKEIISAKIENQALALGFVGRKSGALRALSRQVKSGDAGNLEGRAARIYWKSLFGKSFRREREGLPPNNLLNYGYMLLRAATARAVVGAGLHPSFGIHHRNKYNAFALADDLMEPLRPNFDIEVCRLWEDGQGLLTREAKAKLLGALSMPVELSGRTVPLMFALQSLAASLRRAISGEGKGLETPRVTGKPLDEAGGAREES